MKFYGSFTSPFVRHCRIVLNELSAQGLIECEFIETDMAGSTKLSPTQKVPVLVDGELSLTDSASILKYLREKSGQAFLQAIEDFELFNQVNTVLDASVNVFMIERLDGLGPEDSKYLKRHNSRIASALDIINKSQSLPVALPMSDGELRLACYLDWAAFRGRIDITRWPRLAAFRDMARDWPAFAETAPPADAP